MVTGGFARWFSVIGMFFNRGKDQIQKKLTTTKKEKYA
jgi:hypothetical protein